MCGTLCVSSVLLTKFKHIKCGTDIPPIFSGVGNSALWAVNGAK